MKEFWILVFLLAYSPALLAAPNSKKKLIEIMDAPKQKKASQAAWVEGSTPNALTNSVPIPPKGGYSNAENLGLLSQLIEKQHYAEALAQVLAQLSLNRKLSEVDRLRYLLIKAKLLGLSREFESAEETLLYVSQHLASLRPLQLGPAQEKSFRRILAHRDLVKWDLWQLQN